MEPSLNSTDWLIFQERFKKLTFFIIVIMAWWKYLCKELFFINGIKLSFFEGIVTWHIKYIQDGWRFSVLIGPYRNWTCQGRLGKKVKIVQQFFLKNFHKISIKCTCNGVEMEFSLWFSPPDETPESFSAESLRVRSG